MTTAPQPLANGPLVQDWSNVGLITVNDNWDNVPSIVGYLGDNLTAAMDANPQTVTGDNATVDVIANQTNPNTLTAGGVAEFEIANPVVALQGSATADAPNLIFYLNTTGVTNVNVSYNLRDIDGAIDNAAQQVALQYRIGGTGSFTNVSAGYVADASTGPSLATQVTPVNVTLPTEVDNQPNVQVRVITTNATGSDEFIGVDDINISGTPSGGGTQSLTLSVTPTSFSEAAGASAANGTVTRTGSTASELAVNLASSDTSEATVPTTVTILAGQASASFAIAAVDDTIIDGSQPVTLTASATGLTNGTSNVTVTDNDTPPAVRIREIQGAAHISPLNGQAVSNVAGIVTAVSSNGFYLQDPNPDTNDSTSEGIFVFTSSAPAVSVGNSVLVSGTVSEFRPGGANTANLTTTQIGGTPTITTLSTANPLPATVLGQGGRTIPTTVIDNDAVNRNVENPGTLFDPAQDGIDFYESLEGMLVQVNNAVAVGPTNDFGEIPVLADNGVNAGTRTPRGGIVIQPGDFNPERIFIDDAIIAMEPTVNVGDTFSGATVGVIDYNFGNFKLLNTTPLSATPSGLVRETTTLTGTTNQLTVASFNVENLDPGDGALKFNALASAIAGNLRSPDIISLEEVQDNNGPTNDAVVDANLTYQTLINAIAAIPGAPTYEFRQINPVDDTNGGEPGGNIRVGFLFNPNRVDFVDRPGGTPTTSTTVNTGASGPTLSSSPGLIDPNNPAFSASRKPLAGEFLFNGNTVFVIGNHFVSKGGDEPLFGRFQPPILASETQRQQQATVVRDFVQNILTANPNANVAVVGDLNDFQFSNPVNTLEAGGLNNLIETLLPLNEQYTFDFEGNSQVLDQILASNNLRNNAAAEIDIVHLNAEFADQVSDHDPLVARFTLNSTVENFISTTAGDDTRAGTALNDFIFGDAGNDFLFGAAGNDSVGGGEGNDSVGGGEGNDSVSGGAGNDIVSGGPGDDIVLGFAGLDTLLGFAGNDILNGSDGNDSLNAGDGSDQLSGGLGTDTLTGGGSSTDRDTFVFFSSGEGVDTIIDFQPDVDEINVSASGFGSGIRNNPVTQQLLATQFSSGTATSSDTRFIYNAGSLFFDSDGTGPNAQVGIATLSGIPQITSNDIFVFG